MEKSSKTIGYLDVCRWLATFSVVLCHSMTSLARQPERYGMILADSRMYMALAKLTEWAVPVFLMISGVLYLDPNKKVTCSKIVKKSVRRVALALAVFGIPMCMMEQIIEGEKTNNMLLFLGTVLKKWLSGHCWDHMWYLYMLIGILLITPVIKIFLESADEKTIKYFIGVLFIFTSVIDTLKFVGVEIGFYIPFQTVYLLYFLLGYYLEYSFNLEKVKIRTCLGLVLISGGLVFGVQYFAPGIEVKYASPLLVFYSVNVFVLLKKISLRFYWMEKNRKLCFAIYLVHPFFINLVYKMLGITPVRYGVYSTPLLFALLFFGISIFCAEILVRIPFLNKYVL